MLELNSLHNILNSMGDRAVHTDKGRLSQKSVFFGVQWGGKTDFSHLQRAIFYRPDFRSAVCPGVWQQ